MKWENMVETFSERERHYNGKYMETCEVYDKKIEVNLFSKDGMPYEIYVSFGILYGIIYVDIDTVDEERDTIKCEFQEEYQKHGEPTDEFINAFCEKHKVCMPYDTIFDESKFFEAFGMSMDDDWF